MLNRTKTSSTAVRERLSHPIIDGDGHIIEYLPALLDYMREIAGTKVTDRYVAGMNGGGQNFDGSSAARTGGAAGWYGLTPAERRDRRVTRPAFWALPARTLDRATLMLPALFRERLDDMGIDFCVAYTTLGLFLLRNQDEEVRRLGCRALNTMNADNFRPHADRITPAALIPTQTPEEAMDELEYAVQRLGMKAIVIASCVRRPIKAVARTTPSAADFATWIDVLALGSEYDYDPFWRRCRELGVAVTSHSSSMGWGTRSTPDNYMYNHIGVFAAACEAFCKALVIGGVRRRFPDLPFAFLEGGVGWATNLYNDLIGHWEKRNLAELKRNLDPALLDLAGLRTLFEKYGGNVARRGGVDMVMQKAGNPYEPVEKESEIDDWKDSGIEKAEDIKALFVPNFYFGCEADDRMNAVAFDENLNRFGARLNAIFSSDVGHWDVPDITEVLEEAHELVDEGLISESNFRDFTFTNPARLHASVNPRFFEGTVVEGAVREAFGLCRAQGGN